MERFCAFVIAVPVAVLRRLFFIVVFIVVIDDWFWFPFFIFSLFCFKFDLIPSYITLCERKGSFLPRFRKLLRRQRQIQTDSNHGRREEQQRREKRDARKEERLLSPLRSLLTSSSVLPPFFSQKKITFFFEGENKKKKRRRKEENQFFFKMGETNQLKRTIFYILGVFTSNRSFLHKSKRALQ